MFPIDFLLYIPSQKVGKHGPKIIQDLFLAPIIQDGQLMLEGFPAIPFAVAHSKVGSTFIGSCGRWRYTALATPHWDWRHSVERPTDGKAADLELAGGVLWLGSWDSIPPKKNTQGRLVAFSYGRYGSFGGTFKMFGGIQTANYLQFIGKLTH